MFRPPVFVSSGLDDAEQVGEVVLDVGQVHLVEDHEPSEAVLRLVALLRPKEESKKLGPLIRLRQRVVVAEKARAIPLIRPNREKKVVR